MSDDEDYLSDKFLVDAAAPSLTPKTYAQRRQDAQKQSRIKNERNRVKGRRQREQEARDEGLRKSLFERANDDLEGGENKALGIMRKMGFKVGQSLGHNRPELPDTPSERREGSPNALHRAEPLPLNEWSGKKGIGLGKRARSPGASDRLAKMAKMAEEATSNESFRDFARTEYEERRAEGRLVPAQRTCITLDEAAGITFNVLWLDINDADSVPKGLMDALSEHMRHVSPAAAGRGDEAARLREQMRVDALQPVSGYEDDEAPHNHSATEQEQYPPETVQEAAYFFRLGPRGRLSLVLTYLRDKHAYCFWCGTRYENDDDLRSHCPGPNEDDHD